MRNIDYISKEKIREILERTSWRYWFEEISFHVAGVVLMLGIVFGIMFLISHATH